jgi:hypothetical protein
MIAIKKVDLLQILATKPVGQDSPLIRAKVTWATTINSSFTLIPNTIRTTITRRTITTAVDRRLRAIPFTIITSGR